MGVEIIEDTLSNISLFFATLIAEHASRIMDLNELHWHVAYNTRHEAKAQRRKDAAEEINTGLVEAVKFTKMHMLVGFAFYNFLYKEFLKQRK